MLIIKPLLHKIKIPNLVGFILLGIFLRSLYSGFNLLSDFTISTFQFLGAVGLVVLLFHVGIESNLTGLLRQLPRAAFIWSGNVATCIAVAFWLTYVVLDYDLIPVLFLTTAFTATSIGVSVEVWEEKGVVNSPSGELLLDVAELDDISAVAFMVLVFSIAPVLQSHTSLQLSEPIMGTLAVFVVKLILFTLLCVFFSLYLEQPLTEWAGKFTKNNDKALFIVGLSIIMAAIAGWIGFSIAIGALFAGLAFSRDPDAVKSETSLQSLYNLLTPFFFIDIGLRLQMGQIFPVFGIGLILFIAAVVSKFIGTSIPAFFCARGNKPFLIGISMIPRAEIAMVVMQRGQTRNDFVPNELYAAMVLVVMLTCTLPPMLLRRLLR